MFWKVVLLFSKLFPACLMILLVGILVKYIIFQHEKEKRKAIKEEEKQRILADRPLPPAEQVYYQECKQYYRLTNKPLVSIPERASDEKMQSRSFILKFGIDQDYTEVNLEDVLNDICRVLTIDRDDLVVKNVQIGSCIVEMEILNKFTSKCRNLKIQIESKLSNDILQNVLGAMKIFFMFLGPVNDFHEIQKFRETIKLNPQFNRLYHKGQTYWTGTLKDGKDRGAHPHYCPVGWKKYSLFITDNFDGKFQGWSICYHGTKFEHGLSILLSGLKPANCAAHDAGIYASPSIIYACHPRYSEVKGVPSVESNEYFKEGDYVQFVFQCRVRPDGITKIAEETLYAGKTMIDPNIDNSVLEWVIDTQNQNIVDFNDPNACIVCTGLMIRVMDKHPGLLPESNWWFESHLCANKKCCELGIDLDQLKAQRQNGGYCYIL